MPAPTQDQLNATYSNDDALGLPRGMTAKQLGVESQFNPNAVSPAGALGYAQVMPKTLTSLNARLGRELNPSDFNDSLLIQRTVMGENLQHFGNIPDALRAYNDGWDKSKWNNPETVNYVSKITGNAPLPAAKVDPITRKLQMSENGSALIQSLVAAQSGDRSELDATQRYGDMRLNDAADEEVGRSLAERTHYAGAWEAFTQAAAWDTVTGRIADLFRQEDATPGFEVSAEQKKTMAAQAPAVWSNNELRDYALGATSDREWSRRMGWAVDRADYLERAGNTQGVQAWANGTASLAAGMGDPVTLLATLGTGAVVNAARGAFVVSEAANAAKAASGVGSALRSVAGGAAGNMAVDAAVRKLGNQEIQWPEMFQQGIVGAVLGGLGHYAGNRYSPDTGARSPELDAAARGATATDHALIQRNLDEAGMTPIGQRGDGTVSTDVISTPSYAPTKGIQIAEEFPVMNRADESARLGYDIAPSLADENYRKLHDAGVVTELRTAGDLRKVNDFQAKSVQDIPADAKAMYSPYEDRTYVFRDRLNPDEVANPTGILMHEVGVHYSLSDTVGPEGFSKILSDITNSTDPRVREALGQVPADTPASLRAEEALGYLVEKHPDLPVVANLLSTVRNWLRDNVSMFRDLEVTASDAIRYVKSALANANGRAGAESAGVGANRYSRVVTRDDVRLGPVADAFKKQIDGWNEVLPEATARMRQRAMSWYTLTQKLPIYKQFREMFDSVGLKLALSKSKGVRMWASALAEDATGMNRQHATSAAIDKVKLQAGWRTPVIEAMHRLMPQMMTAEEKSIWSQGPLGATVERRIGRDVAIERLKHRSAVQAGQKYVSEAPQALREAAGVLDSMFKDIGETGEATGAADAANIKKLGYVGYVPYKWDWAAIHHAYNNEPARFNAFKSMLREQYTSKVLTPTMDKFLSKGPQLPDAVAELRTTTMQKVDHLVDNYISQVMRDPKSRVAGADDHFAVVASQILNENWAGEKVTGQMAEEFRGALKEIIADRKRTEFDLIRPDAQGNMLLDFMDTDIGRMVNHNSSKYAGSIALAKKGVVDPLHMTAVKDALRQDGATSKEIDHIDFLYRSLIDDLNNDELPAGKLIQMGAHMTMMGGLGFNAVSDAASLAATSGIKGFISTVGGIRLNPDSPLFKQLAEHASSALGMDHRMHLYDTPTSSVKPESILAQGSNLNRLADAGVQMVNTLSGMKHINQMVHNAYLPVMVEDMLKALKGEGGGLTSARLADTGLHPEITSKIKDQLAKHDAGRKTGDKINWDKWDDQSVADDFISSIHRAAGQTLQRAFIGEVPRWASEGGIGRFMGQFKRFGITAAEKQAARNMFIGDGNSVAGFAFATAWGAALYWAKTEAKMVGMDDAQRAKYEKENLEGIRLATGVAVMVNMSGLLPDAADLGATLFGGGSHSGGSPVAALGYLQNMGKAIGGVTHAAGSAAGVTDHTDYVKDFKNAWRIVPGGNTIFGTALVNSIASQP